MYGVPWPGFGDLRYQKKLFAPLFSHRKKIQPPFLIQKKKSAPFFLHRKNICPLFLGGKKLSAPLRVNPKKVLAPL